MNYVPCLMSINNRYGTLTETERTIADYILKNSGKVTSMTVSELAEASGTVKSAVVRCCKSLGFSGYSQLKLALASELSKNKQLNYTPYIYPQDSSAAILDKILSANVKTLHDTAEMIDRAAFERAVKILRTAATIYIYGVGTSSAIVNDFQYRLLQLGFNAFCFTDVAAMKISSINIQPKDAAVGISHSGRTAATVDALSLASERGADTICITSHPDSRITKNCNCAICIYSDEIRYPIEAISARIAHMSIIDALAVAISSENADNAAKRSKMAHELIDTLRYED